MNGEESGKCGNVGCFSEVCEKATNRSSVLRPTAPFHSLATPDVSEESAGGSSSSTQDLQTRHQAAVQSKAAKADDDHISGGGH